MIFLLLLVSSVLSATPHRESRSLEKEDPSHEFNASKPHAFLSVPIEVYFNIHGVWSVLANGVAGQFSFSFQETTGIYFGGYTFAANPLPAVSDPATNIGGAIYPIGFRRLFNNRAYYISFDLLDFRKFVFILDGEHEQMSGHFINAGAINNAGTNYHVDATKFHLVLHPPPFHFESPYTILSHGHVGDLTIHNTIPRTSDYEVSPDTLPTISPASPVSLSNTQLLSTFDGLYLYATDSGRGGLFSKRHSGLFRPDYSELFGSYSALLSTSSNHFNGAIGYLPDGDFGTSYPSEIVNTEYGILKDGYGGLLTFGLAKGNILFAKLIIQQDRIYENGISSEPEEVLQSVQCRQSHSGWYISFYRQDLSELYYGVFSSNFKSIHGAFIQVATTVEYSFDAIKLPPITT